MPRSRAKRIYLDYAAATPVDPAVRRAMEPYVTEKFGNPGSVHSFGQEAIAAVDRSREIIAAAIGAQFREIIFTGSATEANNLALRGAVAAARRNIKDLSSSNPPSNLRIIISAIEHESVLETARELEHEGIEVVYLPVDRSGMIDLEVLKKSLTEQTILVSVMYANNEIGTIQPIAEIAGIIQEFRGDRTRPLFHTDAAQAFQFFGCNVDALGVDLMTISSHKIYGPKGAGALYIRGAGAQTGKYSGTASVAPFLFGGGQEFGMRSGTENVPAIVGFAKAVALVAAADVREKEQKRIGGLRDRLWRGIQKICPDAERHGAGNESGLPISRMPHILNIYFPNRAAQDLLTRFDRKGLAAASGSACRSRALEASYVIQALGYSKARAKSSIRFSLGRPTTAAEITAALKIISETY